jgi:hypothetical protein
MEQFKSIEEVEEVSSDCPSKKGMVNIWVCEKCGNKIVAVHFDTGVTPFMITCPNCKNMAQSIFYRCTQAEYIWFRPRTLLELEAYTREELKRSGADIHYQELLAMNIEHYNKGGLFMKKLKD